MTENTYSHSRTNYSMLAVNRAARKNPKNPRARFQLCFLISMASFLRRTVQRGPEMFLERLPSRSNPAYASILSQVTLMEHAHMTI
jgi:hypothetical protein